MTGCATQGGVHNASGPRKGVSKTVLETPFMIPWRFNVVADEPCEAAFGCEAVVRSASTINQANRVHRSCDRFALERSLVLLVSDYNTELVANL